MTVTRAILLALLGLSSLVLRAQEDAGAFADVEINEDNIYPEGYRPVYTDADLETRLRKMSCPVEPQLTSAVKGYISRYVDRGHGWVEDMLGRSTMYFPIFETYLSRHNMPDELKYLPIVESALRPTAESRAGAKGLWQFMPATGRLYGLYENAYVDERCDPHKSSDAAARYLKALYNSYNDWALALAAYNAGPGRVNRAIKRARTDNFWKLQKYLPQETRNYVPAFLAACYLVNYYDLHNLRPKQPDYDLQVTESTLVYDETTFEEVVNITGTPMEIVQALNPSYKRGIIPASEEGYHLTLPYHRIGTFVRHKLGPEFFQGNAPITIKMPAPAPPSAEYDAVRVFHVVKDGETLESIAGLFQCHVHNIRQWNGIPDNRGVYVGQRLSIMKPKYKPRQTKQVPPIAPIALSGVEVAPLPAKDTEAKTAPAQPSRTIEHLIQRGESLYDVLMRYPGADLDMTLKYNNISETADLRPGKLIKICIP